MLPLLWFLGWLEYSCSIYIVRVWPPIHFTKMGVDEPQYSPQHLSPLAPRCLCPFRLRFTSFCDGPINTIRCCWVHSAEQSPIGRAVALYSACTRYLYKSPWSAVISSDLPLPNFKYYPSRVTDLYAWSLQHFSFPSQLAWLGNGNGKVHWLFVFTVTDPIYQDKINEDRCYDGQRQFDPCYLA